MIEQPLKDFVESIVDANGPYKELNGKPIIAAAYAALQAANQSPKASFRSALSPAGEDAVKAAERVADALGWLVSCAYNYRHNTAASADVQSFDKALAAATKAMNEDSPKLRAALKATPPAIPDARLREAALGDAIVAVPCADYFPDTLDGWRDYKSKLNAWWKKHGDLTVTEAALSMPAPAGTDARLREAGERVVKAWAAWLNFEKTHDGAKRHRELYDSVDALDVALSTKADAIPAQGEAWLRLQRMVGSAAHDLDGSGHSGTARRLEAAFAALSPSAATETACPHGCVDGKVLMAPKSGDNYERPCPIHGKPTETAEPLCAKCGKPESHGLHTETSDQRMGYVVGHAFVPKEAEPLCAQCKLPEGAAIHSGIVPERPGNPALGHAFVKGSEKGEDGQ